MYSIVHYYWYFFSTDTTKIKCDSCDKMFRNKPQLRVHKVQAHMEKRFKCDFCDWKCSYKVR